MSGPTPEDPVEHAHRPLPSVGIPLLKEERRAQRSRQMAVWSGVVAAGVVVVAVLAWSASQRTATDDAAAGGIAAHSDGTPAGDTTSGAPANAKTNSAPPPPGSALAATAALDGTRDAGALSAAGGPGAFDTTPTPAEVVGAQHQATSSMPTLIASKERITRTFGRARSFHHALLGLGMDEGTATALENALSKVLDFRRCHAEDTLAVERDDGRRVTLFEYHASRTEYVRARRQPNGGYVGERVPVPVDKTRIRKGGSVRSSLGDSLDALGLGRTLAGAFQLALQRSVDFGKQTRAGRDGHSARGLHDRHGRRHRP